MISRVNSINFKAAQPQQASESVKQEGLTSKISMMAQKGKDTFNGMDEAGKGKINAGLAGIGGTGLLLSLISGKHKILKGLFAIIGLGANALLVAANLKTAPKQEQNLVNEAAAPEAAIVAAENLAAQTAPLTQNETADPAAQQPSEPEQQSIVAPMTQEQAAALENAAAQSTSAAQNEVISKTTQG